MNKFGGPFDALLDPGERLLWSGQPKQGLRLQASDAIVIPFSLVWCAFVFVWEAMALHIGSSQHPAHGPAPGPDKIISWIFPLWGIPFILVGLYQLIGRFFFDAMARKKTWYGVTDRRLIVLKSSWGTSVNSYDYGTLINLNLVERGDRSGDILFGAPLGVVGFPNLARSSRRSLVPGFYLLPDARNIYNQIRDAQQRAKK